MLNRDSRTLSASLLLISTLLTPLAAVAQQSPVEMSVSSVDAAVPMISVANNSSSTMTAFLVTVDLTRNHTKLTRLYFDVYAHNYGRSEGVLGGASSEMPLPHFVGAPLPRPVLRAAIFEDGTTWGDATWVADILEMRKILWLRTAEASTVLRGIAHQPVEKSLGGLRWARQFRKEAVAAAPAEKQLMHDWLFSMAVKNLDENSPTYNKPAERALVVEHFAKYFEDWRASLEASKPSITAWSPSSPSALDLESKLIASARPRSSAPKFVPAAFHPSPAPAPRVLPTCAAVNTEPVAAGGNDASKFTAAVGVCGNQTWELIAEFSGQTFDKGPQEAFGVCTGGYLDCAGVQIGQGKEIGRVVMFGAPSPPAGTIGFGWTVDSWVDINGSCSSCPNPPTSGQTQAQADHSFPTPTFFVNCQ